jgi:isopenicillin N synthase-like dioxygenase
VGSKVVILGEHTDFDSIIVLFNQLSGLQVLNPTLTSGSMENPQPGCAIINLGEAIVKLVGNRLYSGVHRVVGPPGDQAKYLRHSVVYFSGPEWRWEVGVVV